MEFDLARRTCYLIVSGSHSYGGQTEDSDYDLRGWCIPPREYFLTFDKRFDQNDQKFEFVEYPFASELADYIALFGYRSPPEDEIVDHCIYSVHKFFKLAADCNPNLIENLFVDESEVLICNEFGRRVREHRDLFLSARAKHTFTGYAVSQLKRINTHRRWLLHPPGNKPERRNFGLPESSVIPADQREAAEKLVTAKVREWLLQDAEVLGRTELALFHNKLRDFVASVLSSRDLVMSLSDEQQLFDVARLSAMQQLGMSSNYIAVLQAEKKYRSAINEWKQYQHWKESRNPERAKLEAEFGYDTKHGMQLVRLLVMGRELLTEGKVVVKRSDRQFFLDVRQGRWSYERIIKYLEDAEAELSEIYRNKRYVVPHKPKVKDLSKLCLGIVEEYLDGEG